MIGALAAELKVPMGLFPIVSSHLAGAESEKIVPAGHTVFSNELAVLEIKRILDENLVEKRGRDKSASQTSVRNWNIEDANERAVGVRGSRAFGLYRFGREPFPVSIFGLAIARTKDRAVNFLKEKKAVYRIIPLYDGVRSSIVGRCY